MIFFCLTDMGLDTKPIIAADIPSAIAEIKNRYGLGLNADNSTSINVALLVPEVIGTVNPNGSGDPTQSTLSTTGDAATLATIRQNASTALANNATYLAINSPTNAQVVAQVAALTRQVDGLIRIATANLTGTT